MIHIFVGTKAQFIKMAPVMQELDRRNIAYNLIDAGQHAGLTPDLLADFGLPEPNVKLRRQQTNIDSVAQAIWWTLALFSTALFRPSKVFDEIFRGQKGVCLIHGDTLTTLLSLIFARRCKIDVAHVEAGLRSFKLLDPFPEEIIRLIAMRYSQILFAPSEQACENLESMGYLKKTVRTSGNTIADTVKYAEKIAAQRTVAVTRPYMLATIHRVETIFSRDRLQFAVTLLEEFAKSYQVLFALHPATKKQLERYDLLDKLKQSDNIQVSSLLPYVDFLCHIINAEFVLTDGGSIQEECFVLDKKCLILRDRTERADGIGANAFIVDFDFGKATEIAQRPLPERNRSLRVNGQPSNEIVDYITRYA